MTKRSRSGHAVDAMEPNLPSPAAIATLLGTLFGVRPRVVSAAPLVATDEHAVATYRDESGRHLYAAVVDCACVAAAGAALALVPSRVVNDCVARGALTPTLKANAFEVLDLVATLLTAAGQRAIAIDRLNDHAVLDREVKQQLRDPASRLDLAVTIPGYPDGKLTLLALR